MRRLFFDVNHPVQALMLRPVIEAFEKQGYTSRIFARDKDVTLGLLERFGLKAETLALRRRGRLGAAIELVAREARMLRRALTDRPLAIIGTSVHAARVGRACGALSIVVNDDDAAAVPLFARLAYPLADMIVTPECLAFEGHARQHTYRANQQLFYLHPSRFSPASDVRGELHLSADDRFAVVRLSALDAHHDVGVRGVGHSLLARMAKVIPKEVVVLSLIHI